MFLLKNFTRSSRRRLSKNLLRFSSNITKAEPSNTEVPPAHILTENFGQPTPWTHPHLLKDGEVVPNVKVAEFKERRNLVMQTIQETSASVEKNHIVIVPSAVKRYISDKIPYVFRQNSDFFYLTGCTEPDTILVMTINEYDKVTSTLFMRPKDKNAELWDGPRTGVENALELFGVDESFPVHRFRIEMEDKLRANKVSVWYDEANSPQPNVTSDIKVLSSNTQLRDPTLRMQLKRLIKSPAEMDLMRRTCKIASDAINETIMESKPGHSEHQIFAMVDYKTRMKGASYLAYPPVVASGNNATTIHYINNTQMVKSGDLVLMDAGCEYGGYTSDITRTWPVNGEFSEPQKVLYDVVATVQEELMGVLLREGGDKLDSLFETMCTQLGKYLQEVGLVQKFLTSKSQLARAGYGFCPHHVSHYLGMDVHDTPLISKSIPLVPGMVCTVEPGIYIANDRIDVPKEFRGIGIRIEDDVLITDSGIEVLTADCVKDRSRLEAILKAKSY